MAETQTAPGNKLVRFRGRAEKEFTRAYKRGLISDKALNKAKRKFAKKAGHNPPKPTHAQSVESVVETVSRPVAAAANQLGKWFGKSSKTSPAPVSTMGIRG
jgi:hypothetical protein